MPTASPPAGADLRMPTNFLLNSVSAAPGALGRKPERTHRNKWSMLAGALRLHQTANGIPPNVPQLPDLPRQSAAARFDFQRAAACSAKARDGQ